MWSVLGVIALIIIVMVFAVLFYGGVVWLLLWATNKYLSWPAHATPYWPNCVVLGVVLALVTSVFGASSKSRD